MTELAGISAVISPWLIGGIVLCTLMQWRTRLPIEISLGLFAIGGLVGYAVLATLIFLLDRSGFTVFKVIEDGLMLGLALLTYSLVWAKSRFRSTKTIEFFGGQKDTPAVSPICLALLAQIIVIGIINVYQFTNLPLFGWDALGFWSEQAVMFVNFDLNNLTVYETVRVDGSAFPWQHDRHPMTLIHIAAFSAATLTSDNSAGVMIQALSIWISGAMIIGSFTAHLTKSLPCSLLVVVLYMTLPLAENHLLIVGYAEIWCVVTTMAALFFVSIGICESNKLWLAIGAMVSVLAMYFKNIGIIYSFSLLFPISMYGLLLYLKKNHLSFRAMIVLTVSCVAIAVFTAQVIGFSLLKDDGGMLAIKFSTYTFKIFDHSPVNIPYNILWALFINSSFSTLAVAGLCLVTFFHVKSAQKGGANIRRVAIYAMCVSSSIIILLMVPQLSREYSQIFANPEGDTGNSRFILPAMVALLFLVAPVFKVLQNNNEKKTGKTRRGGSRGLSHDAFIGDQGFR